MSSTDRQLCGREISELLAMLRELGNARVLGALGAMIYATMDEGNFREAFKLALQIAELSIKNHDECFAERWETVATCSPSPKG